MVRSRLDLEYPSLPRSHPFTLQDAVNSAVHEDAEGVRQIRPECEYPQRKAVCLRFTDNRPQQHAALFARAFSATARRGEINKVYPSAAEAIKDMKPNSTLLCGGFGLCGVPDTLINEVLKKPELKDLTAVSNNAGTDNSGLGQLLRSKQIKKMVASYIGENKTFETMYLTGEVELELTPQGTLAERCAAGGKGIPAFYTPAAFGTVVQTGELPLRNKPDGTADQYSYPKDVKVFNGKSYLLEHAIAGDYAFVKAYKADRLGNCQFRLAANNFNGAMGRNAKMTIVEAEHIVEPGEIPPEAVHLPGIYVKRVIQSTAPKGIEKYTWSKDPAEAAAEDPKAAAALGTGDTKAKRERIVRRAAKALDLARQHPVGQIAHRTDLHGPQDRQVNPSAADHAEALLAAKH